MLRVGVATVRIARVHSMLLDNASHKIAQYNRFCVHYNLVADGIYRELHRSKAPLSQAYEPFLIAALIAFDMGRMMGEGIVQKYDPKADGFATRLHAKLQQVESKLAPVIHTGMLGSKLKEVSSPIREAYDILAAGGQDGLHTQGKDFHVGATKLLHFLNPEMFLIIDRNSALALREVGIPYTNTTQPGYSSERYVQSLTAAKDMIEEYGAKQFRSLEDGTPLMRVFDKIAYAHSALAS